MNKFNSGKFKLLITKKIHEKGYRGVRQFVDMHNIPRSPLTKAMAGITRPSLDSLNHWCKILECTPQERAEMIGSVYIGDEEEKPAA